jgi:hypothetical protein
MTLTSIEQLRLADLEYALPFGDMIQESATEKGGSLAAGHLVGFTAGMQPRNQSDVLNSLLFAQLAASAQYDRQDHANWYGMYNGVLEQSGWVIQNREFTEYVATGSSFTINDVVLQILAGVATPGQLAAITAAVAALKSLSDKDHRLQLWDRTTHKATSGNLQVGAASDEGGAVAIASAALRFTASQQVTNVLWFHFSKETTHLQRSATAMSLSPDVYATVRDTIVARLGDRAAKYVADLPLAD